MNTARTFLAFAAAAASCLALPHAALAQKDNALTGLQIKSSTDGGQLLNSILGSGVTLVGTPTLVGQSDAGGAQQGLFSTVGPDILGTGFSSGIVLTTGYASNVIGPNTSGSTTQSWNSLGDTDLDKLSAAISGNADAATHDANSLTFDFTVAPGTSKLGFNYVFGSEEYNEFVKLSVNDVFAFYVDGTNVAVLPGTDVPVSIDTVNNGNSDDPSILASNPAYFRDNSLTTYPNGTPFNTELDGLTTVLYADVFKALDPNKSVHTIKLAIADGGDTQYDSAVFIQGSSFSSTPPPAVPEAGTATGLGIGLAVLAGMTLVARRRAKSVSA